MPQNLTGPYKILRRLYLPTVLLVVAIIAAGPGLAAPENVSQGQTNPSESQRLQTGDLAELIPKAAKLSEKSARLTREGILLALATLGFKLTNLRIIASALSVRIGFGLQTIVNNFVCGLILLFERPVKVGDIIQTGEQWATIRDIGLRATTIQTFDRSDIVVPNSDLITNQVTNWTLADRNMRLSMNVGVAYGSDVPLVLQTLEECTRENRHVLKNPAPLILFMGFGDSSLDFQLRVWIDDIDYINGVRSELNQEIDRRFRERRIEIPFPQRDLNLRSVDPSAASALSTPRQNE